jgi:hypothetical protein
MEVCKTVCSAIGCALNSGRCVALGSEFTSLFVNYRPVRSWVNVWLRGCLPLLPYGVRKKFSGVMPAPDGVKSFSISLTLQVGHTWKLPNMFHPYACPTTV